MLGAGHRRIGVFDEFVHAARIVGIQADADRRGNEQLLAIARERPGEFIEHDLGGRRQRLQTGHIRKHEGELVAAHSGDGIGVAGRLADTLRGLFQQGVADVVAQGLVNHLEAIQVDMHERDPQPVAMRMRDHLREPVLHQEAVWQAGQHVVVGEILHSLLGTLALGDVARGKHDAADARMIEQVVAQRLEMDPGAVRVTEAHHDRRHRSFASEQRIESIPRTGDVFRMKGLEWRLADQCAGRITQNARRRRRLVHRHPV